MKLFLLIFLSLFISIFSKRVTVTKSFSISKSYSSSNPDNNNGDSGSNSGSGSEDDPSETPGAENYHACDPTNRPSVCTLEHAPVCGYIHECEGGACTATFGNGCEACSLDYVEGFVNGTCEDAQTACNPDNRPQECAEYYTATCAVAGDCQGNNCWMNVPNDCFACRLEDVAYWLPGVCPKAENDEERVSCYVAPRPEVCTADYDPVCAHTEDCFGDLCWTTAGNACGACSDRSIDFYVPGECSDEEDNEEDSEEDCEENERVYCEDGESSEVCTADYNPVCARVSGCEGDGDECWSTAGNACSACADGHVDYYVPGEC